MKNRVILSEKISKSIIKLAHNLRDRVLNEILVGVDLSEGGGEMNQLGGHFVNGRPLPNHTRTKVN